VKKRVRRIGSSLLALALVLLALLLLFGYGRRHPEDLPWTPLDLGQPVGAFTGRKLADLADDRAAGWMTWHSHSASPAAICTSITPDAGRWDGG